MLNHFGQFELELFPFKLPFLDFLVERYLAILVKTRLCWHTPIFPNLKQ
jgi:hypothetical protein